LYQKIISNKEKKSVKLEKQILSNSKLKYLYVLIPAGIDFIGANLSYFSLFFMNPSIYIMMRGGFIVTVAVLSKIILKKKLFLHHYIGCIITLFGIIIVGYASFLFKEFSRAIDVNQLIEIINVDTNILYC